MRLQVTNEFRVEQVGGEVIVLYRAGSLVHRLSGAAVQALRLAEQGVDEADVPAHVSSAMQSLIQAGVVAGAGLSRRRLLLAGGASVAAITVTTIALASPAAAASCPAATVRLGSAGNYAVLGASTVTDAGASTLNGSLGLWPGTSVTGFPPGVVLPPWTTDVANAAAMQAQSDLTVAYNDAAARPITATTTADLANLLLGPGVYSGPALSPLSLSGPLVLDGGGNVNAVFIFRTESTLTTATASTVTLINGAQARNVFWQVGSSATLGTYSVFAGTILALASITVTTGVTVKGRALARNAAVTLDGNSFTLPSGGWC